MITKDKDEILSLKLYVLQDGKKKIYPFIFEDLNDSYNIERFPDRVRRKPKAKRKYNYFANIYIILGYKYFEYKNFKKGYIDEIAKLIHDRVAVSVESIKVKISQLKAYIHKNKKTCSYDLIKIYKRFKTVPYIDIREALSFNEDLVVAKNRLDFIEDFFKQKEKEKIDSYELDKLMQRERIRQNIEKNAGKGYYISNLIDY